MGLGWFRWIPIGLFVAGAVLVGLAVYQGTAHVGLIVIIPFFYGASLFFLLGVLAIAAGFILLPLALSRSWTHEEPEGSAMPADPGARAAAETDLETTAGGFLLVGPVPVLFGKWGKGAPRLYWTLVAVGLVLTLLAVTLVLFV